MSDNTISTEYDDIFRTLLNDHPRFAIPLINEFFGTDYSDKNKVHQGNNELFIHTGSKNKKDTDYKRITDSSLYIDDDQEHRFHIECQSENDNSMIVRMYEYDFQIAFNTSSNISNNTMTVTFPKSGVLYLRSNANTPDTLHIKICIGEQSISHDVTVIKMKNYSIEDILKKNLLFLLPFYIFNLEKAFKSPEKECNYMTAIQNDYLKIAAYLDKNLNEGKITEYEKVSLRNLINKAVEKIANKHNDVKKGVEDIMGGKIIDYEAKTIYNRGLREGEARGEARGILLGETRGILLGETRINKLNAILAAAGKIEELTRSFTDKVFQNKLLEEYKDQINDPVLASV